MRLVPVLDRGGVSELEGGRKGAGMMVEWEVLSFLARSEMFISSPSIQ